MLVALFATVSMSAQHVVESKFFDNTYASVSVGATVPTTNVQIGNTIFHESIRPMFGLEIGKDFTTLYGMSLEGKTTVNNKGIHTIFDDVSVTWKHKFNVSNAIWGFNPDRKWEVKAVGGLGWGHDNGCVVDNFLVAEAGAEVLYNISNKWSFNMRPTFVWEHVENGLNVNKSEVELSVGFSYKFGKNFTKCNVSEVVIERDFLNDQVNALRAENDKINSELTNANALIVEKDKMIGELQNQHKNVTNIVVPSVIGFKIGKSEILPTNEGSLINLAKFLNDNNDVKIDVVGHADAKTGTTEINQRLSEARANAVKDALVKLGVSAERINAIGKGDTAQLFDNNDANRAVITFIR